MPKGSPSKQTIASAKYQAKAGYMSKSFKLKRDLVEQFMETCERTGTAQSAWLTKKMQEFIEENRQ